jgi:hypothetical protein
LPQATEPLAPVPTPADEAMQAPLPVAPPPSLPEVTGPPAEPPLPIPPLPSLPQVTELPQPPQVTEPVAPQAPAEPLLPIPPLPSLPQVTELPAVPEVTEPLPASPTASPSVETPLAIALLPSPSQVTQELLAPPPLSSVVFQNALPRTVASPPVLQSPAQLRPPVRAAVSPQLAPAATTALPQSPPKLVSGVTPGAVTSVASPPPASTGARLIGAPFLPTSVVASVPPDRSVTPTATGARVEWKRAFEPKPMRPVASPRTPRSHSLQAPLTSSNRARMSQSPASEAWTPAVGAARGSRFAYRRSQEPSLLSALPSANAAALRYGAFIIPVGAAPHLFGLLGASLQTGSADILSLLDFPEFLRQARASAERRAPTDLPDVQSVLGQQRTIDLGEGGALTFGQLPLLALGLVLLSSLLLVGALLPPGLVARISITPTRYDSVREPLLLASIAILVPVAVVALAVALS